MQQKNIVFICDNAFNYIILLVVEKNSKVSFGTTLTREIFPSHVPKNRFGNDLTPIRGAPNRGPGCYNNEEVFFYIS